MPEPRFRSRSLRRVQKPLPGGKTVTRYEKRNPTLPKCAECKQPLKGIPRERPYKMKDLPKSKKTVERPFGGNLCSKCSRAKIKGQNRK